MTKKQDSFYKNLPSSTTATEAARKAGYAESSCRISAHRNLKNITKYNDFLFEVFTVGGVDVQMLGDSIKQGLQSENESIRFRYVKLLLEFSERLFSGEVRSNNADVASEILSRILVSKAKA